MTVRQSEEPEILVGCSWNFLIQQFTVSCYFDIVSWSVVIHNLQLTKGSCVKLNKTELETRFKDFLG